MRVDQIITLVWVGNVALLGGTGWVGWKFWEEKRSRKPPAEVVWPDGGAGDAQPPVRWPGPVTNFRHVWETPLNGPVPPPPPPPDQPKKETIDLAEAFRRRVSLVAVIAASNPFATAVQVNDAQGGGAKNLGIGQDVDDWRLVGASVDAAAGLYRARFENPAWTKGTVEITAQIPKVDMPDGPKFTVPVYGGVVERGSVKREKVERQAVRNDRGEWLVPPEECDWWVAWGEEDVVQKTKFVSRDQGLEIASQPPRGPLDSTRGLNQGDLIVSVNGTPVRSVADLLAYLRGPGASESRFEVVIERDGARRTQVYNVHRRHRTAADTSARAAPPADAAGTPR